MLESCRARGAWSGGDAFDARRGDALGAGAGPQTIDALGHRRRETNERKQADVEQYESDEELDECEAATHGRRAPHLHLRAAPAMPHEPLRVDGADKLEAPRSQADSLRLRIEWFCRGRLYAGRISAE